MSEKGGKGIKSSLKSPYGSGKDDNSTNSKKTRKVQFDQLGTQEPNYKFLQGSDEQFQGFSAKGGKGNKSAKASKSCLPKESQPLGLKTDKEIPENATCIMDCEAFQILQGIKEQVAVLSEDPSIKIPVSFDRGLEYVKCGSRYTNPESVRQLLEPLKMHGISEGEMCMIANVCPETTDEVYAFVPSMKGSKDKIDQPLQEALMKLTKLKKST